MFMFSFGETQPNFKLEDYKSTLLTQPLLAEGRLLRPVHILPSLSKMQVVDHDGATNQEPAPLPPSTVFVDV